jgi:hypothetical protein
MNFDAKSATFFALLYPASLHVEFYPRICRKRASQRPLSHPQTFKCPTTPSLIPPPSSSPWPPPVVWVCTISRVWQTHIPTCKHPCLPLHTPTYMHPRMHTRKYVGYYDVCAMGGEVRNPKRTIPGSCIITCLVVLVICIAVYISVIGVLPWYSK